MSIDRKEQIILATLELAADSGLGTVSLSKIAAKVGIKKPSLYKHFRSKEEIILGMYEYLRENAKKKTNLEITDYEELIIGKSALEVLQLTIHAYRQMASEEKMKILGNVINSERVFHPMAAKLMIEETNRMIIVSKKIFQTMENKGLLKFSNLEMTAVSYAMAVHSLINYENDQKIGTNHDVALREKLLSDYLIWFCNEYAPHKPMTMD